MLPRNNLEDNAIPSDCYNRVIARADKENGYVPGMAYVAYALLQLGYENDDLDNHYAPKLLLKDIKWNSSEAAEVIFIKDFCDKPNSIVESFVMDTKNDYSRLGRYVLSNSGFDEAKLKLADLLVEGTGGFQMYCEGVQLYEKLIKDGNRNAPYELAIVLLKGGNVPVTINYAMRCLIKGVEMGCLHAMKQLTEIYQHGLHGQSVNVDKMCNMLEKRASTGKDSKAVLQYSSMLLNGTDGVRRNPKKALKILEMGGKSRASMWNLASLLEKGAVGLPRNEWRALDVYKELTMTTRQYSLKYRFALARMYRGASYHIPSDHNKVRELCNKKKVLQSSARFEYDDCKEHIEYLYDKKNFVNERERQQAFHWSVCWVRRMVNLFEDQWTTNMAGVLFWETGDGNFKSMFETSMDMGSKVARFNLANRLCRINCAPKLQPLLDIKLGIDLYEVAVTEGDYHAMIELGLILKNDAYLWYDVETNFQRASNLLKLGIFLGFRTNVVGDKKWQRYGWSSELEIIEKLKMDGSFESKVYDEAFDYEAEESGVYVAMLHLAEIMIFYHNEPDIEMGLLLVEKSAINAETEGLSTIGTRVLRHIIEDRRVSQELRMRALRIMESLIGKTGDVTTMRTYALYILKGINDVQENEAKAVSILKRAAFAGDRKSVMLLTERLGRKEENMENCYESFRLLTSAVQCADYSSHFMRDAIVQLSHLWLRVRQKMTANSKIYAAKARLQHWKRAELMMGKKAASIRDLTSMLLHDRYSEIAEWIFVSD